MREGGGRDGREDGRKGGREGRKGERKVHLESTQPVWC